MAGKLESEIDGIINFVETSFPDGDKSGEQKVPESQSSTSYACNYHTVDSIKNGDTVYITNDFETLRREWDESEVGPIDDPTLRAYLSQEALVVEIEEDDETIKARWTNYDSQWMPIKACSKTPTGPCSGPPMLGHLDESAEPTQKPSVYINVDNAKVGQRVWVTEDFDRLEKYWQECELGPLDDDTKKSYLRVPCEIREIEEDDESAKVRWDNYDTQWIPIEALTTTEQLNAPACPILNHLAHKDEPEEEEEDYSGIVYLDTEDDFNGGEEVWVTRDFAKLRKEWDISEVGPMEDRFLKPYRGCKGKIIEIEEDDETLKLRWTNYDTQWMPWKACTKMEQKNNGPPMLSHLDDGNDGGTGGGGGGAAPEEAKPLWWNTISYKSTGTIQKKSTLWVTPDIDKLKDDWGVLDEKHILEKPTMPWGTFLGREGVCTKYKQDGRACMKWADGNPPGKAVGSTWVPISVLTQTRIELE